MGCVVLSTTYSFGEPVTTPYTTATLKLSHSVIKPGDQGYLNVSLSHSPHWHSYWQNPGDSGAKTTLQWTLPAGIILDDISWPNPELFILGPIINFGFNQASLIVPFTVTEDFTGNDRPIQVRVSLLVCEESCIPERFTLETTLSSGLKSVITTQADSIQKKFVSRDHPRLKATLKTQGDKVILTFPTLQTLPQKGYFYPHQIGSIQPTKKQDFHQSSQGLRLVLPAGPEKSKAISGILQLDSKWYTVEAIDTKTGARYFLLICGLALLGGIILNIMPCVFPILSLKVLGILEKSNKEKERIKREANAYTWGVIVTFLAIGGLLAGLKIVGYQLGWGFQLQHPFIIFILLNIMMLVGLNLNDVFQLPQWILHIPSMMSRFMSKRVKTEGLYSHFFTGVLAVFVATPCTAPFMATAIGYALTQSVGVMLSIFLCLAIGFSSPFILIAYNPFLQRYLPKSGKWMVTVKHVLAIPMYGTVLWLAWVLSQQIGVLAWGYALGVMCVWIFYSLWNKKSSSWLGSFVLIVLVGISMMIFQSKSMPFQENEKQRESLEVFIENKQRVFVDVTASWCVTCQVNERTVINSPEIQQFFKENNIHYIVLDWTHYDDEITHYLESFQRQGVPLYVYYNEKGERITLPQLLTKKGLKERIKESNK